MTIDPRVCAEPLPRAFPSRRGCPSSNANTVVPRSSRPMAMLMLLLPTSPPLPPPPSSPSPSSSPPSLSSYCRRLWSSWSLPPLRLLTSRPPLLCSPPPDSFHSLSRFRVHRVEEGTPSTLPPPPFCISRLAKPHLRGKGSRNKVSIIGRSRCVVSLFEPWCVVSRPPKSPPPLAHFFLISRRGRNKSWSNVSCSDFFFFPSVSKGILPSRSAVSF